ncbi:unnamed protein product [Miscanthus lutarioriparius]|uniref:Uncharacterized protein n=1 Tax=Miscanthus lutarioriparius TaxID=422564 RepID=A0A811PGZ7_9POAL|nr:unnamed protein product [Miscanthus lutarioriparius]
MARRGKMRRRRDSRWREKQGFDEYMTLVLDDAEEINVRNTRKSLVASEDNYGRNDGWRLP